MATGFVKKDKQRDSWYYEATLEVDEKGKRIRKKKRFDTKKEAQQALADLLNAANKGEYVEPSKVLYKNYLSDWLDSKKISVRESTWKSYSDWVRLHIIPALGELEISKITPQRVEKFMLDLSKNNYAGSTMQKIYTIIKDSLNKAERWQMIDQKLLKKRCMYGTTNSHCHF
ncbi:N-terminal phage integrase SAM-like domain-containing protein [Brevibacillus sp. AY1]|uniref:N-terminal phage integrase SAM-like domain-containing protein n=1 Tax=Brevibacillus sp. AY1 TaxID=2807621 RepID=UPI002456D10B|nr:N-terminal phage integrase SAM-like domain-containing protein [Brevibacillus sp. AY1]